MRSGFFLALAALALAACGPDDAQIAEAGVFNRPAAKLRACFGPPDQRRRVGVEEIWTYRIGAQRFQGWLALLDPAERPTFSAPSPDCEAQFTVDSHGVRGIAYADALGKPLPLGQACDIAVRRCLDR